ncbi:G-protein coupled receptor [Biomphalaria glabrata]|nr:G-protein coupled receptor [Biomphalaria glabrata]
MDLSTSGLQLTTTVSTRSVYNVCFYKADSYVQYMSLFLLMCFINPTLSLLGFIANMMSLTILHRSGLQKTSNILLFSLVIADTLTLFKTMDYAVILIYFGPDKPFPAYCGFQYVESLDYFLAISAQLCTFFSYWGRYTSSSVVVAITIERLIAVYAPMNFRTIVTAHRITITLVFLFLFWLPWHLFFISITGEILIKIKLPQNRFLMLFALNVESQLNKIIALVEMNVIDSLASWFPLSIVVVGCVSIAIKMKISMIRRRNLTWSKRKVSWSRRTTMTLMLSCVIFVLTHSAASAVQWLFFTVEQHVLLLLRSEVISLLYTINASSNLLVYIACNRTLFDIFCSLIGRTKK